MFPGPPRSGLATAVRGRAVARARFEAHALGITATEPERLSHVLRAATHGTGRGRPGTPSRSEDVLQDLGDTLAFGFVRRESP